MDNVAGERLAPSEGDMTRLEPAGRRADSDRIVLAVFGLVVVLNYAWEMAQAVLYEPMESLVEASWRCFVASVADGVMVVVMFAAGALMYRRVLRVHGVRRRKSPAVGVHQLVSDDDAPQKEYERVRQS